MAPRKAAGREWCIYGPVNPEPGISYATPDSAVGEELFVTLLSSPPDRRGDEALARFEGVEFRPHSVQAHLSGRNIALAECRHMCRG